MRLTAWICIGGGLGAMARFAVGGWVTTWAGVGFPWATFLVNVSGSVLLGFVHRRLPAQLHPSAAAFLTVGFCGGFTTFSTFDFETLTLLQDGRYGLGATYSAASVLTCVAGVFAGDRAGRTTTGTRT